MNYEYTQICLTTHELVARKRDAEKKKSSNIVIYCQRMAYCISIKNILSALYKIANSFVTCSSNISADISTQHNPSVV